MHISLVPPDQIDNCWPFVRGYLAGAAEYTYGRYMTQDVYEGFKKDGNILWIAFNDEGIKGAVVTNFVQYPRKRFLMILFVGGVGVGEWQRPMIQMLQKYAKDTECDGIESTARLGWERQLRSEGYKPLWKTFELPVADTGLGDTNG